MANVSSSNGLEKRPKLRFPSFDEPWEENELSHYLVENTERNRGLAFGKGDVLSVSGEYGVINQIAFQGRSFAGESVADYHIVGTDDIVYTKSPLKAMKSCCNKPSLKFMSILRLSPDVQIFLSIASRIETIFSCIRIQGMSKGSFSMFAHSALGIFVPELIFATRRKCSV
ncbi:hypothetical protein HMPREF0863_04167 [Erysipelotrichaceae bacterium 5_2_54FAA]|nr:hypothetical protein HMPREF0863_04167 [Erysipelotrichaceae bacterium 5_2_54FAA]